MTPVRLALLLLAVCGVAAWQLTVIPPSLMQMTVGPVLAPAAIVAALTVVALLYGLSAWRGRQVGGLHCAGHSLGLCAAGHAVRHVHRACV